MSCLLDPQDTTSTADWVGPTANHYNDSVIPAPVILFRACHNQKCILSLLTLDNSERLPWSSFLWYQHDLGPQQNFSERMEVYFSYTDIWAGHLFWRNELLGLKQLPAITGQFSFLHCNATDVSYEE
jgi:hypothetical protein